MKVVVVGSDTAGALLEYGEATRAKADLIGPAVFKKSPRKVIACGSRQVLPGRE